MIHFASVKEAALAVPSVVRRFPVQQNPASSRFRRPLANPALTPPALQGTMALPVLK